MVIRYAVSICWPLAGHKERNWALITFLVSDLNRNPLRKLIRRAGRRLPPMRTLTYQTAFRRLRVPDGTLVFTDFDLLTDFEMDAAGQIAIAADRAGDRVRTLNSPSRSLERAAMHRHLHASRLNAVQVTRVADEMPTTYPVFIRLQGGCESPDTGLLHDETEYRRACDALLAAGRPLRGRIAVSYEAEPDASGNFRKYGAFRIGDHIIPQHILRRRDWYVKRSNQDHGNDFRREEIDYIRNNPHRDRLMALFQAAGHEFGRMDYTIRGDEIVVFEINSNPSFPDLSKGWRKGSERHALLHDLLQPAFESISHGDGRGHVSFALNAAIGHNISRRRWNPIARQLWRLRLTRKSERGIVWPSPQTDPSTPDREEPRR